MTDIMLTMGSRNATSEDIFLFVFLASQKWRPTLVKTFETSNELIMKKSGILPWGEWYVEGLGARRGWRLMIFLGSLNLPHALDLKSTRSTRVMVNPVVGTLK